MPSFQGSGFLIGLPEGCTDASAYTFLLPTEGSYTPFITIRAEHSKEAVDIEAYAATQQKLLKQSVENLQLIKSIAGKHAGMDVVLTTVEWGDKENRICQKIAYFVTPNSNAYKIYTLTGSDLASQFQKTEPIFDQVFKTFAPNDMQLLG